MVDLPEVTEEFSADTAPFVGNLQLAIDAAERFRDMCIEATIAAEDLGRAGAGLAGIVVPAEAAASAVGDVGEASTRAAGEQEALGFAVNSAAADLAAEAVAARADAEAVSAVADSAGDAARASTEQAAATTAATVSAADAAKTAYLLAMAQRMQANTARDAAGSTAIAGAAAGAATGWWARWGNVIHWVIAGGSEFLAVFIPATVAAGGAAAVMAQGVGDVTDHLEAMYTAQEATANIFHTTTGEMVGMKDVLQQAQNAADPRIFELLGAGINIARVDSGQFVQMGVQVLNVLDQFAAKITGELTGALGGQLHSLVSDGTRDLAGLGAVLGNVGHMIINLAGDMPGLAEVLLAVLDGATRLLSVLSGMPGVIITVAMGFEEFGRWGSLVSGILGRLTGSTVTATGAWYHLWGNALIISQNFARAALSGFANVSAGIGNLLMNAGAFGSRFSGAMQAAGEAEVTLGEDGVLAAGETTVLQDALYSTGAAAQVASAGLIRAGAAADTMAAEADAAAAAISPMVAFLAVAAVAALGFLIYKFAEAKGAVQQWAAAMNSALSSASDLQLVPKIAVDIADASQVAAANQQKLAQAMSNSANEANGASDATSRFSAGMGLLSANAATAAGEQEHLDSAMQNVLTGAGMLAKEYSTTFTGALAIAQGAGVNLTQSIRGTGAAAVDARLQIANYIVGMQAMGESSTVVGHDVTLLGISSELSATKVSQLNQAVDQFVSGVTGGTADLGALSESITNIGQVTGSTANYLASDSGSINLSIGQVAQSLTNFGQVGAQTWQNFDNALSGSGEQLADWFRTAATEGAVGAPQFTKAMQDIVAQFIPFAADSKTAQQTLLGFAQAQGLTAQTFPQLVSQLKSAGASTSSLTSLVGSTTAGMANMNQIAQNLGASLGTDVVGAMNNARLAASGLTTAAQGLAQAWNNAHQINTQVVSGFQQTYTSLYRVYGNTGLATQAADAYATSLGLTQTQVNILNGDIAKLTGSLNSIPRNVTSNVHVQTIYSQSGSAPGGEAHAALPGYQSGAPYVPPGLAYVGEHGPELVRFGGGESVTPAWQTAPISRAGGGGAPSHVTVHVHAEVDGRELFQAVADEGYQYDRRNGLGATGSFAPGT